MAESTGIGWTDATFNPWVGCEKVSPGCAHCYAETLVTGRMGRAGTWGAEGRRERTSEALWRKPLRWDKLAREGRLPDGSASPDGHRPRVFCASLADVFEPRPELEPWRHELFALIERCPSLDWQILTKRPEEARDWLRMWIGRELWTLPNVWLGVSIENSRFTWRADVLREVPAAVRFISAEPLLGSLLTATPARDVPAVSKTDRELEESVDDFVVGPRQPLDLSGIDWLIVGGESGGRDARPMHPQWARELRDACLATQEERDYLGPDSNDIDGERWGAPDPTAFFFKQFGSWQPDTGAGGDGVFLGYDGRALGPMGLDACPDALKEPVYRMRYAGASPKSGGAILDGREWQEFPEPARVHA